MRTKSYPVTHAPSTYKQTDDITSAQHATKPQPLIP